MQAADRREAAARSGARSAAEFIGAANTWTRLRLWPAPCSLFVILRPRRVTMTRLSALAIAALLTATPAAAQGTLRIAMTASDIPTATGMPNNGFEGMRFMGYPIFEGLVLWALSRADKLAGLRPGLAEKWEQAENDKKTWIFRLRRGVKFHDGTDFTADAVIWNFDRFFKNDSPQFEPPASGISRARVPLMDSYKKVDDRSE